MAEFPADRDAVGIEIKKLVNEKGLAKITSKIIREHLTDVFGKSFDDHKKEVDDITRNKIQEIQKEKNGSNGAKKASRDSSPATSSDESEGPSRKRGKPPSDSDASSVDSEDAKPVKKRGKKGSDDDSDYDLASKVKKRRAGTKKEPKAKKPKKTAAEKKPGAKKETGYMKQCVLSDELYHVFGKRFMKRSEVVKEMWAYIKKHQLNDPKNKQFIIPDETIRPVFKCSKFKGFGMMKYLKVHIKDPEHLDEATLKRYRQEEGPKESSGDDVKDESGSDEKEEDDGAKPSNSANNKDDEEQSGSDTESD